MWPTHIIIILSVIVLVDRQVTQKIDKWRKLMVEVLLHSMWNAYVQNLHMWHVTPMTNGIKDKNSEVTISRNYSFKSKFECICVYWKVSIIFPASTSWFLCSRCPCYSFINNFALSPKVPYSIRPIFLTFIISQDDSCRPRRRRRQIHPCRFQMAFILSYVWISNALSQISMR